MSPWERMKVMLTDGPMALQDLTNQEAATQDAFQRGGGMFAAEPQAFNAPNPFFQLPEAPAQVQPQAMDPQQLAQYASQSSGPGVLSQGAYDDLIKRLNSKSLESQKLQAEGINALQDRLAKLQATPTQQGGLGKALAAAADVWGGGGGTFTNLYNQANPMMNEAQKQEAILKMEDMLRKSRGELTDSEIDLLKAQLGYQIGKDKLSAKGGGDKVAGLNATEKGNLGSIATGLRAVSDMMSALGQGDGPRRIDPSTALIGTFTEDTEYSAAERVLSEVIGRLQSGGAISSGEQAKFTALGPRPADSAEMQKSKLNDQYKFLTNKLQALGFQPQELPAYGFDTGGIGMGGGGLTPEKQKRLMELRAKKAAGKI